MKRQRKQQCNIELRSEKVRSIVGAPPLITYPSWYCDNHFYIVLYVFYYLFITIQTDLFRNSYNI